MIRTGKENKKIMRQWITDCRCFFKETAAARSERNWELLRPMSLIYLAVLCLYLLIVCPIMDNALQDATVKVFTVIQCIFTLFVFLHRKKTPSSCVVNLSITLFAVQILGLAGFLDIAVFPNEVAFIFPLCLILMTQIYTLTPILPILYVLIPAASYLLYIWLYKSTYTFFLDTLGMFVAVAISATVLFAAVSYKMTAYRSQAALQKMCALDPMTEVNNKTTFEFLVEEFMRSYHSGSYALAICDFDDFKSINDNFGHHMGDAVLKAFASKFHAMVDNDPNLIAGRFGGDEFVLFIKHYDSRQDVIEKVRKLGSVSGFDFPVTCSIGISFSPSGYADFMQLFEAADHVLYNAKKTTPGDILTVNADASKRTGADATNRRR